MEGSIATGSPSGGAGQVGLAPARLCPHCAAPSQTAGEFCPYCGRRFSGGGRSGFSTRVKWALAGLAVLLVLGGAGVAVAIKLHHDDQVAAQHQRAAAAATARAQAARRAAQAAEVSSRQSLETGLQDAITKDATQKANQGLLFSGAPTSTVCTPVSGGSSQDLSKATGTYSCSAEYQTNSDGTSSGYRYTGTINFATGLTSWQLGGTG